LVGSLLGLRFTHNPWIVFEKMTGRVWPSFRFTEATLISAADRAWPVAVGSIRRSEEARKESSI